MARDGYCTKNDRIRRTVMRTEIVAGTCFGIALLMSGVALSAPFSAGPIPPYTAGVQEKSGIDSNSSTIKTKDKVPTVVAWYQAHLPKGSRASAPDPDGGRIFYLPDGATVDV